MRNYFILSVLMLLGWISCTEEKSTFDTYFTDATLRIDYFHIGDAKLDSVAIDEMLTYGVWAGSKVNLIDTLKAGVYAHNIYDAASKKLIYSRKFDSYFKEYQMSEDGVKGIVKTFHESAIVPMPQGTVTFELKKRLPSGEWIVIFEEKIDPSKVKAANPEALSQDVLVYQSQNSGDAAVKADIAIIAEGYTADEVDKFKADIDRFTEAFFQAEPCKSNRELFNIYGVLKPSKDSGVDEPRAGIFKETAVSATFNALGSERYLLTEDNKSLRDIAAHVPYDALYIMVNSTRYGGGGIYNFYCTFTSNNIWSEYLMVHEFGHSFFGLADEYYTSSTAYDESFYPEGYEPAEENITAETDPKKLKWRHLLSEGVEVPTPWEKEAYDEVDNAWQKERARMNDEIAQKQKEGAPADEVNRLKKEYDEKSLARSKAATEYLESSQYFGKVGVFEGAGYVSKGLYRGSVNCIMFTRCDYFCPVCQEAMTKVIHWYAK